MVYKPVVNIWYVLKLTILVMNKHCPLVIYNCNRLISFYSV